MRIDPDSLSPARRYFLLTSCILPRPIAWAGTANEDGSGNLAPFSFFNGLSSTPPICGIGFGPHPEKDAKDTLRNIRRTGALTISLPTLEQVAAVEACGADLPYGTSEFDAAGVTAVPGSVVDAPRIGEARISFECALYQLIPLGEHGSTLVLAEIRLMHIDDELLDERGCVAPDSFNVLARMAGGRYAPAGRVFKVEPEPE